MYRISLFILTTILLHEVECAKIFIYMGTLTSYSPTASVQPLADKLASRGHDMTMFTSVLIPTRNPSVKIFYPPDLKSFYTQTIPKLGVQSFNIRMGQPSGGLDEIFLGFFDQSHKHCEALLKSPALADLLGEKFDLVIVDNGLNECGFPLAHLLKARTILYSALSTFMYWEYGNFGIPAEISWLPGYMSRFSESKMSFMDRLVHTTIVTALSLTHRYYHLPKIEQIYRASPLADRFKDMPSLEQMYLNVSLMLMNTHHSDHFAKSLPPFVIPVGGMSVNFDLKGTLPPEMENFIGSDNFIYISFGSFVRVSEMPRELIQIFFDVLADLKVKVLWKWEGDLPKDGPKNIFFHPWFNQQEVLSHKKIRGFLTQGGAISSHQGVPLIVAPVVGDQDVSAMRMEAVGNGIRLELVGLTKSRLKNVFTKILEDPSYAKNAKRAAAACRDRPMSAVDSAVWWVEYVLRTDDTSLLRPLKEPQPLWLLWNLDVWAFLFGILVVVAIISLFLSKWILFSLFKCIFCGNGQKLDGKRVRVNKSKMS